MFVLASFLFSEEPHGFTSLDFTKRSINRPVDTAFKHLQPIKNTLSLCSIPELRGMLTQPFDYFMHPPVSPEFLLFLKSYTESYRTHQRCLLNESCSPVMLHCHHYLACVLALELQHAYAGYYTSVSPPHDLPRLIGYG